MRRISIATLCVALSVSCLQNATESVENQEVVVATKSARATAETISLTEQFTSQIKAYKENDIIPAASGVRIDTILFEVGDKVKEGDVVATLDPTLYNQQMINVANLQADYDRLVPVYEAGGISRQMLDQAKTSLDVQMEVASNLRKNIELRSPISGVVTSRPTEAGDLFSNQPILHIARIDKLKVMAQISEQFFPQVKVGMPIDVVVEIYPEELFKGEVSLIYPALDSESRTFSVEVTLPNEEMLLRPGMFGRTTFNMGSKAAIMVPDIAVQKQFGSAEHFVYVIEEGVAKRRRVITGRQVGDKIDILSGVVAGDEVATTAFSRISDGVKVEIK